MINIGMGFPNRDIADDDISRIHACKSEDILDLNLFNGRWNLLNKNFVLHGRYYNSAPLEDAQTEANRFINFAAQYPYVQTWRYRNEPGTEFECSPTQWNAWLYLFGIKVRAALPNINLFTPAISPGISNFTDFLAATYEVTTHSVNGLKLFSGRDVHAYGNPTQVEDILYKVRSLDSKDILLITEHNFGAGQTYDLNTYAQDLNNIRDLCVKYSIRKLFLFIWQWYMPDIVLPTTVDIENTVTEVWLQENNVTQDELSRYAQDIYARANVAINKLPDGTISDGFYTFFLNQLQQGKYIGRPEENAHTTENGQYMVQAHSNTILSCKVGEWVVSESLPPLS